MAISVYETDPFPHTDAKGDCSTFFFLVYFFLQILMVEFGKALWSLTCTICIERNNFCLLCCIFSQQFVACLPMDTLLFIVYGYVGIHCLLVTVDTDGPCLVLCVVDIEGIDLAAYYSRQQG